jgi:general secretion pathway protein M
MNELKLWFTSLQARERQFVVGGAAALVALVFVFGLLMPLHVAVNKARGRVDSERLDLAWMQAHADEIRAAGNLAVDAGSDTPLVVVDRTGREAGLASALRGTQPNGTSGVRVQLEGAAFDNLVTWLSALEQRHGLAIEAATIDRAGRPGTVNASVTLARPGR